MVQPFLPAPGSLLQVGVALSQGKSQIHTTTASPACPPGSRRWGWKGDRHSLQKWQDDKETQGFHFGHLFPVISLLFGKIEKPSCDLKPHLEMGGPKTCAGMRGEFKELIYNSEGLKWKIFTCILF